MLTMDGSKDKRYRKREDIRKSLNRIVNLKYPADEILYVPVCSDSESLFTRRESLGSLSRQSLVCNV